MSTRAGRRTHRNGRRKSKATAATRNGPKRQFFGLITPSTKVKTRDVVAFAREFATLIDAGVSAVPALQLMKEAREGKALSNVRVPSRGYQGHPRWSRQIAVGVRVDDRRQRLHFAELGAGAQTAGGAGASPAQDRGREPQGRGQGSERLEFNRADHRSCFPISILTTNHFKHFAAC